MSGNFSLQRLTLLSCKTTRAEDANEKDRAYFQLSTNIQVSDPIFKNESAEIETTIGITATGMPEEDDNSTEATLFSIDVTYTASFIVSESDAGQFNNDEEFKKKLTLAFANSVYLSAKNRIESLINDMELGNVEMPWNLGFDMRETN